MRSEGHEGVGSEAEAPLAALVLLMSREQRGRGHSVKKGHTSHKGGGGGGLPQLRAAGSGGRQGQAAWGDRRW